ncbi:MAG: potassium/proton antiporter [Oligoflexia bacterium]|nr:potassium/proton antiporter [Oligoflexia bacterium]
MMNKSLIILSILMIFSVLSSKLSGRYGLPSLVLFLAIGMLAGADGIGGIHFADYEMAKVVGIIALIFILFSGGLDTLWSEVRDQIWSGLSLSTLGVLISTAIVGLFASYFLHLDWAQGLLLGAIISPTDAAAVFLVLKTQKLQVPKKVIAILELESGSNDPICIFMVITLLEILTYDSFSWSHTGWIFVKQMGIGFILGFLFALISRFLLDKLQLESPGLYPVLTIGLVLLNFGLCEEAQGNGFLSVYIHGLLMPKKQLPIKDHLSFFHEGIAWNMQVVMFIGFGLLVAPNKVFSIADRSLWVAFVLVFVARPVSVFISLLGAKLSFKDKLMISWMGLRGAVPIVLAIYPMLAGIKHASLIFNVVFFVVLSSLLLQGTSIHWMAVHFFKSRDTRPLS